jgi:hypothetical protein
MAVPSARRSAHPCRRFARPASLALLVGALWPVALGGGDADALRGWCRVDPEVHIAGQTAHVQVDLNVPNLNVARQLGVGEPIRIVVSVPPGVDANLLAVDHGLGQGYDFAVQPSSDLTLAKGVIPVKVDAFIPMQDDGLAVRVAFVPAGSMSNQRPSHHVRFGPPGSSRLVAASSAGTTNQWISVLATR